MNSLSIILPTWSATPELTEMALDLAKTIKPMCDELVITEDAMYNKDLAEIADIYILHPRLKHGANLAVGFRASTGSYVALIDYDVKLLEGNIRDMCIEDTVVCPKGREGVDHPMQGWFVVAPRWIVDFCPPYDRNDFHAEGIDFWADELYQLTKDRFLNCQSVQYTHGNSRTYREFRKLGEVNPIISRNDIRDRLEEETATKKAMVLIEKQRTSIPRETQQDRHRQRLEEDAHYRRLWLHSPL